MATPSAHSTRTCIAIDRSAWFRSDTTAGSRTAEPHDYGMQKGIERLLVYQLRAPVDRSGKSVTGWRLLDVSQIEDCVVLDEGFPGSRGDLPPQPHGLGRPLRPGRLNARE